MKKLLLVIAVLFVLSVGIFAQSPQTVPTPPLPDDGLIKISTSLIQVDVTVTDKKGNIITDLKPEEFEVYENGKKQDITNFSFITQNGENNSPDSAPQSKPVKGKDAVVIPPVKLKPEQVRRTYALVVDDLGLNFGNVFWVKQSLRKFVNEQMLDGDLVAIIKTGSGIGALQSFTSDKRQLLAAIEKIKWNSYGRSGISTFEPIGTSLKQDRDGTVKSDGTVRNVAGTDEEKEFERQITEFRNDNFSVGTLGALNYIIRGMRDLPGRKSIMLFSEGFALSGPDNRVFDGMRVLADLANRASVVIYTLDPRGLQIPSMFEAQDNVRDIFDSRSISSLETRESNFLTSQMTLRFLAYQTGGIPFINQNDLDKGIRQAIADQSGYYLLGYEPDETTFDPKKNKFNKLEIRVTRPDVKVRYRSGFFGITDEKIENVIAKTPQQKLADALISPFGANEINLNLYSIFYNDEKNRNFIRSFVYINPNDLNFTLEPDGMYHTTFNVIAAIFNTNGASADNGIATQTLKFTKEQLSKVQEKGIIYDLPVAITKTGAFQFRMAFQDVKTGKIGAVSQFIEIPNVKKGLTMSGLFLDNFTPEEWQKIRSGEKRQENDQTVLFDTTVREYRRGTILRYDYEIYNFKKYRQLENKLRLIKDGKVIYEEDFSPIKTDGQIDLSRIESAGAITLGKKMEAGNYVLQIIVADANKSKNFTTQFVEFEIIE